MDFKYYPKLLNYLENHNSLCSSDFNVLGFEKHGEAIDFLKSLHSFGNLFEINQVKSWYLTDKGKDYIEGYEIQGFENVREDHLYYGLTKIGRENFESLEESFLKELEEKDYIKKSEIEDIEVRKGEGFSNGLILSNDLTHDILTSNQWKDVIFSSYDYSKTEKPAKYGSCHTLCNFINDIRQALFELGFKEVIIPSIFESSFLKDHSSEILEEEFDCMYRVSLRSCYDRSDQESINQTYSTHLRSSLFLGLLSEISSLKVTPTKLFSIGKVFQNKEFDSLNIPEFHALEIMISDSELDLSNVLGICSGLFSRLNITYTDFKQAYFPYTSPTAGIYLYNEILDAWIVVGKGGIIRPEFTKKIGFSDNVNVLRLGFSIERILLNKKETDDITHLLRWEG